MEVPKIPLLTVPNHLREAAKSLRNNSGIVIRKADKSSIYALLDKSEYLDKIDHILSDQSKFSKIRADPTNNIKTKTNKLIETLNAAQDDIKLFKIIGDYKPGYIYRDVKTHKPNNPLRPIISQVPTATYQLAKKLNKLISPFMPQKYSLKSTNDFVDLLHSNSNNGIIASLDVESLFTNVPIDTTIDIITQYTHRHPTMPPLKMPENILKQLLKICTSESPFKCPRGHLYTQIEGVAMGSPLGPTFAGFYMGHLEEQVLSDYEPKPNLYARYIDDVFLQIENENEIAKLKTAFEQNSVLKFTFELSVNHKLPYLDVLIDSTNNSSFNTIVYRKPTDNGTCLNANSFCPDKYKNSVIYNYLNRAYKITQNWQDFNNEINNIKPLLVNNNYSNTTIDQQIKKFLSNKFNLEPKPPNKNNINIYYFNQMHINYKTEEQIIKNIICNNVQCTSNSDKVNIIFYYKNRKTHNLVMQNNLSSQDQPILQQTNVVYKFSCPLDHHHSQNSNQPQSYIGHTQTTISRRLSMHAQTGSIKDHFINYHHIQPGRKHLTDNISVIARAPDKTRLTIKEAILIIKSSPSINKQSENFSQILKLQPFRRSSRPFNNPINASSIVTTNEDPSSPTSMQENLGQDSVSLSPVTSQSLSNNNITTTSLSNPVNHINNIQQVSPSIQNRINNLLKSSRNKNNSIQAQIPPHPMTLRSRNRGISQSQP